MNRRIRKRGLQWLLLGLTACLPSLSQNAPSQHPTEAVHPQLNADSDLGLTLVSAQRVYLTSRVGETIATGLFPGRSGFGRIAPHADKALAGLTAAISEWHRFTIVDAPVHAELVLTIIEGNQTSGLKTGTLTEKLQVRRDGSYSVNTPPLWESTSQDGDIVDYRPVATTVKELRSVIEDYEKKIPQEKIAQARAARKTSAASGGCAAEQNDDLDCLSRSRSVLFLRRPSGEPRARKTHRGRAQRKPARVGRPGLDAGFLQLCRHPAKAAS